MILAPLLSIPSPSDPLIAELGIFKLRWYGTLIAIGILLAGWLSQRELDRRGYPPGRAYTIATWCIPAGVIGARLYHVVTDWSRFSGHLEKIPLLQQGGLGMPGVIVGGAIGAAIGAKRAKVPVMEAFDIVAPGLILAQAIGRWGNYFNQELFGGPTDLPWGLEIDREHRPEQYLDQTTFHPTFLYESLWNLLVFVILMRMNRRLWLRAPAGTMFAAYLTLYAAGRAFVENLRVDPAAMLFGTRFNLLLFIAVFFLAGTWLLVNLRRTRRRT